MRTPKTTVSPLLPASLAAAALCASCVDSNNRTVLGRGMNNGVVIETFTAPQFPDPKAGPSWGDDRPSLTSLNRDSWAQRSFLVPVDGTRHRPTYATVPHFTDATARQRNEYPTLLSSLNLDGSDSLTDAGSQRRDEALVAPFHALGEMLLIPLKLIFEDQSLVEVSPAESYQRRPPNPAKLASPALHPEEELLRRRSLPQAESR